MEKKRILEAALFMSSKPLKVEKLARIIRERDLIKVRLTLAKLMEEFNASDRCIRIYSNSQGFQMRIQPEFEQEVGFLALGSKFNKAVLKSLALIALHAPVKQSEIVRLRNTKAYDEIKILEDEGFISRERKGISYSINLTKKFQKHFGSRIQELKELQKDFENQKKEENTIDDDKTKHLNIT
ncbi:MAG: SMC-Scp complex subunit ScpB [archaeon]